MGQKKIKQENSAEIVLEGKKGRQKRNSEKIKNNNREWKVDQNRKEL